MYCMAGSFRGMLIFASFVVDLAVTKFSHAPTKINAYGVMRVHDDGRGHKHHGKRTKFLSIGMISKQQ